MAQDLKAQLPAYKQNQIDDFRKAARSIMNEYMQAYLRARDVGVNRLDAAEEEIYNTAVDTFNDAADDLKLSVEQKKQLDKAKVAMQMAADAVDNKAQNPEAALQKLKKAQRDFDYLVDDLANKKQNEFDAIPAVIAARAAKAEKATQEQIEAEHKKDERNRKIRLPAILLGLPILGVILFGMLNPILLPLLIPLFLFAAFAGLGYLFKDWGKSGFSRTISKTLFRLAAIALATFVLAFFMGLGPAIGFPLAFAAVVYAGYRFFSWLGTKFPAAKSVARFFAAAGDFITAPIDGMINAYNKLKDFFADKTHRRVAGVTTVLAGLLAFAAYAYNAGWTFASMGAALYSTPVLFGLPFLAVVGIFAPLAAAIAVLGYKLYEHRERIFGNGTKEIPTRDKVIIGTAAVVGFVALAAILILSGGLAALAIFTVSVFATALFGYITTAPKETKPAAGNRAASQSVEEQTRASDSAPRSERQSALNKGADNGPAPLPEEDARVQAVRSVLKGNKLLPQNVEGFYLKDRNTLSAGSFEYKIVRVSDAPNEVGIKEIQISIPASQAVRSDHPRSDHRIGIFMSRRLRSSKEFNDEIYMPKAAEVQTRSVAPLEDSKASMTHVTLPSLPVPNSLPSSSSSSMGPTAVQEAVVLSDKDRVLAIRLAAQKAKMTLPQGIKFYPVDKEPNSIRDDKRGLYEIATDNTGQITGVKLPGRRDTTNVNAGEIQAAREKLSAAPSINIKELPKVPTRPLVSSSSSSSSEGVNPRHTIAAQLAVNQTFDNADAVQLSKLQDSKLGFNYKDEGDGAQYKIKDLKDGSGSVEVSIRYKNITYSTVTISKGAIDSELSKSESKSSFSRVSRIVDAGASDLENAASGLFDVDDPFDARHTDPLHVEQADLNQGVNAVDSKSYESDEDVNASVPEEVNESKKGQPQTLPNFGNSSSSSSSSSVTPQNPLTPKDAGTVEPITPTKS